MRQVYSLWILISLSLSLLLMVEERVCMAQNVEKMASGILLEELTWIEAEKVLTPKTVVVIPLGAAAKEHGPHLKLKNDLVIAEYLKQRVLAAADVVVAPTVNYNFYPAFVEYPGSISLNMETARDLIVDICRSLARYGPRRFYVLNTGVSTRTPLKQAAALLALEGILMRYTDTGKITEEVQKVIKKQEGGTHADEIETSMMLYMDASVVDMSKAVKDYHPDNGRLTRDIKAQGTYSPTGIWGDPTLATKEKGEKIVETLVRGILKEITELSQATLP